MPAAAISINSADAVDGELFHLDLFQNAGLFVIAYFVLLFRFHLHFSFQDAVSPSGDAFGDFVYCNGGANYKTLIYIAIRRASPADQPRDSARLRRKWTMAQRGEPRRHEKLLLFSTMGN
jgi:hypothetical protein